MMPPDWPRGEARAAFGKAFDALAPLAEARVRDVLGRYGESLPAKVEAITTAELAEVGELGPELPV
jgi:phenylacetic acid degradation operon negative regulatory protein